MQSTRPTRLAALLVSTFALALLTTSPLPAQTAGAIVGTITDTEGNKLSGAVVLVQGVALSAVSDDRGSYRLPRVPSGSQTLSVSYLGYHDLSLTLEVAAGATLRHDVRLERRVFGETVTVSAEPLLEGQARALNQQKSAINIVNVVAADQIGRFPDPNAAEATQRLPGVTLERDQGEGRYVLIRGTEARLNSMMINGERIPSPEGDVRSVALDVIPAELLDSIEVSKAITPDMDGDAIGGAVNLVTKRVTGRTRVTGNLGLGYNDQVEDGIETAAVSYGGRHLSDNALGVLLSGSYLSTDRGSDNIEPAYDDGELEDLDLRDYVINRERKGVTADLDYRAGERSELFFHGIFNEFADQEFRRTLRNRVGDERLERELKDRLETQQIISLSAGGETLLPGLVLIDYRAGWSYAEEAEPGRLDTVFRQDDVVFAPNVSEATIDPNDIQANPLNEDIAAYTLDEIVEENNLTTEEDFTAAFNVSLPFDREGGLSGLWKFGAKLRNKEKDRDNSAVVFSPEDDLFLTDFLGDFNASPFFDGQYQHGPFFDTDVRGRLLDVFAFESEEDVEADLADFTASEDTLAAYAMSELVLNEHTTLLAGLRFESTDVEYSSVELVFDEEGDLASLQPVSGENSYDEILPMLHVRRALDENSNLRFAVTRSLARPNYVDLAPSSLILEEDREIERGNPDLDLTTAWNVDLLYDRYFTTVGVFSAGVFYKSLENTIFLSTFEEERGGETFDVLQPLNGDSATILGFELAYQSQLRSLPAPFDGLGIYLNYTYTDSDADLPGREGSRLPGQPESVGNFALTYEKGRFSGRLAWNYHGKYLSEVAESEVEDIFIDDHFQIDFAGSLRLSEHFRLYLELINLGDEPFRRYQGTSDRPVQEEFYSWWGTLGLKIDF